MASNVSRYQPRTSLTRLPDLMSQLFNDSFVLPSFYNGAMEGTTRPSLPVNLFETPNGYVMQAALPGAHPEKFDIQVTGREVTIKGTTEIAAPDAANCIWQGIGSGEFYETYTLPVEVDGDKVEASFEYGVLTLTLPKAEHLRPKNIKVNAAK